MTEATTVGAAVAAFRAVRGIPPDGGASTRWVTVRALGLPVTFPNFAARRAILFAHDVHHVLTGYETTWRGEAEIGAFELRTGCRQYWAAWMFNSGGFLFGLAIAPMRTFRAFVRARSCTNFYGLADDAIAARPLHGAIVELGLDRPPPAARARDIVLFAIWALAIVLFWIGVPVAGLTAVLLAI